MGSWIAMTEQGAVGVAVGAYVIALLIYFGAGIVCGAVSAHIAGKKSRNKIGYFFLGLFFDLIGVIIALLVSDLTPRGRKRRIVYEEYADDADEEEEEEEYDED